MTDHLRPPPYRRRLREGEEKPAEGPLPDRDRVLRSLVVILGLWIYSGIVFLVREVLPGGNYPWPFAYVPSFVAWPIVLVCTILWAGDPRKRKGLLLALTVLLAVSVPMCVLTFLFDPVDFWIEYNRLAG